jgi:hypothetical protein
MRYIILAFLLTGCTSEPQPPPAAPAKVENKEKDKYIEKVEAIVSDSASALTAVVPVLDKGTVREVVEAQVTRLSGVAKPSVAKTQEFQKIIATNDKKAVEKDKKEASKVDAETDALWLMVEEKDYELMEAHTRADAEFKQKVLWQFSTAGLGLFTIGLLALALTPFKKSAGTVMAGGMLAMASAWIFDSTWFTWIMGGSLGVAALSIVYAMVRKPTKNPEEATEEEHKGPHPPLV